MISYASVKSASQTKVATARVTQTSDASYAYKADLTNVLHVSRKTVLSEMFF